MTHDFYPEDEASEPASDSGAGCCSASALAPLVILVIGAAATLTAFRTPGSLPTPALAPDGASRASAPSRVSGVFTPEVRHWASSITAWSDHAGLDPNLVATVMQIESCGDPRALSRSGAIGLFQVMPYHFAVAEGPYTPDTNAARGLSYLSRALTAADGNARLAFAGYNGGIGVIGRPEWTWPDETVRYAYWGSGIYSDASAGTQASPRLEEWLAAGGASLCRSARQRLHLAD